MFKKTFQCKKCGQKFEDRKALGKHIYHEHNENATKELIIPAIAIKDSNLLSEGQYTRLICEGTLTKKGFLVDKIRLA